MKLLRKTRITTLETDRQIYRVVVFGFTIFKCTRNIHPSRRHKDW